MKKIISFIGSDHKCGTSMISLCCAEYLANSQPDKRVLLAYAQASSGKEYCSHVHESMERLKPYINEKLVNIDEICAKAIYRNNFYVIGGAGNHTGSQSFDPEGAAYFFKYCTDVFDYVICDAGAEVEHGLSLGALLAADEIVMIMQQRECSVRRYEEMAGLYDKLNAAPDLFVLNMYNRKSSYDLRYISERLFEDENKFLKIADTPYGDIAEIQSKSLLQFKSLAFKNSIKALCERITDEE